MASTTTDRIDGLSTSVALKAPCRATTTGNITLSGEQTIDGVAVVEGDRVLVKDQTDASENGIYVVGTSAWQRAKDFNGARDAVDGTRVYVVEGSSTPPDRYRLSATNPVTIGTDDITWVADDTVELDEWNVEREATYVSSTSFTLTGDERANYHVERRVKATGGSTGTIYGTITGVSLSTDTTVTVTWDSGSLSNEDLTVWVHILSNDNPGLPRQLPSYIRMDSGIDRPLFSTADQTVTVGSGKDYSTPQEAVDACPVFLHHDYDVRIDEGDYTGDGTILVPAIYSPRGVEDGTVASEADHIRRFTIAGAGGATKENVKLHSVYFSGGSYEALVDNFKCFDRAESKYSDEASHIIAHYGVTLVILDVDGENDTAGVDSGSSAALDSFCLAYGGDIHWKGPCVLTGNSDGYNYYGRAKRGGYLDAVFSQGNLTGDAPNQAGIRAEGAKGAAINRDGVTPSMPADAVSTHGTPAVSYDLSTPVAMALYQVESLPTMGISRDRGTDKLDFTREINCDARGSFDGDVRPLTDNAHLCGVASLRWSDVYAVSGSVNTSDAREKQWRGPLTDAELQVASGISHLIGAFRWHDRPGKLHVGVTAQDLVDLFSTYGLDAHDYGVVVYDQWQDEDTGEHKDRYGIRYDQLWAFACAGIEQRLSAAGI